LVGLKIQQNDFPFILDMKNGGKFNSRLAYEEFRINKIIFPAQFQPGVLTIIMII